MTVEKIFEFASKPEQSGLSSSIRLDAMIAQTLDMQLHIFNT